MLQDFSLAKWAKSSMLEHFHLETTVYQWQSQKYRFRQQESYISGANPVSLLGVGTVKWGVSEEETWRSYLSAFCKQSLTFFQNDSRVVFCFPMQSCKRRDGEPRMYYPRMWKSESQTVTSKQVWHAQDNVNCRLPDKLGDDSCTMLTGCFLRLQLLTKKVTANIVQNSLSVIEAADEVGVFK